MSKLETNTIDTVSGTSTLQVGSTNTSTITLGVSGDTVNVPSGVTIANSGTATGFGGTNTPAFLAYVSGSNFSLPNTTYTKIIFNSEKYDTASAYDTSTALFTVPSGQAGKYALGGMLYGGTSASRFILRMRLNNSSSLIFIDGEKTAPVSAFASTVVSLSVGDTVQIDAYQNSGGAINLDYTSTAEANYFLDTKL